MTTTILSALAKEFSIQEGQVARALELLSEGHRVPYLAHYRRAELGGLAEGPLRRLERRRRELEELEKRRGTLLTQLAKDAGLENADDPERWKAERAVFDRAELEDYHLHHRTPEPEVQLALDRGLDGLAAALTEFDRSKPQAEDAPEGDAAAEDTGDDTASANDASTEAGSEEGEPAADADAEPTPAEADAQDAADAQAEGAGTDESAGDGEPSPEGGAAEEGSTAADEPKRKGPPKKEPYRFTKIQLSPELARACEPFIDPDKGVHNDLEAVEGAARILADRVARDPSVRAMVRRLVRKHGRLAVYPLGDEKRLGRFKSMLKQPRPLRQLQGHKLLELRQAQAQRLVTTAIDFDPTHALGKVQARVCKRPKPFAETFVRSVCEQALIHRILPMVADDIRNELRERAEEEGMRRVSQVLRQVLLSPVGGRRTTAGVHVDAKGDWTIVGVDQDGAPIGEPAKVEASSLPLSELAQSVQRVFADLDADVLAVGAGKGSREAVNKLRETLHALQARAPIVQVSEAGLTAYANSETARKELGELPVPARIAASLARRFQDPLGEFLKCEPRQLVGGKELGAVGKANLRRVLSETVESAVAMIGCDVNEAPVSLLRHVPGVDFDIATKIAERRSAQPFERLEELRELLPDERWTNAAGFLRIRGAAPEVLDRTALHPDQYAFAREVVAKYGIDLSENLGRKDGFRGLKKADFQVDDDTWRALVRELAYPGRDPRLRNFPPRFLPYGTEPESLEAGTVVEGVVTNVSSFGAFVDLGLSKDGMVHISEASNRYVNDVRAQLSVGQVLRAKVVNASGPRVELSLKDVPSPERRPRTGGGGGPRRRREGGQAEEAWPQFQPMQRVATARRDGLGAPDGNKRGRGKGGPGRGGGGGGGRGGPGQGPGQGGRGGGRRERRGADENYDRDAIKRASGGPDGYNPFASFFKEKDKDGDE